MVPVFQRKLSSIDCCDSCSEVTESYQVKWQSHVDSQLSVTAMITTQCILLLIIYGISTSTSKRKTETELKYEEYLSRIRWPFTVVKFTYFDNLPPRNVPLKNGPNIEDYKEPPHYSHNWFVGDKIYVSPNKDILMMIC